MNDSAENKTHLVLVNGIVFNGDKVLLSQRSWDEPHEPGKWTIPGGKVERTKDEEFDIIEKTLKSEILEETGIEIDGEIKLIANNTFLRSTGQHVIALVFKCRYKNGEATPLEDTIDCKWATLEEVKEMEFSPNVKEYILRAYSD